MSLGPYDFKRGETIALTFRVRENGAQLLGMTATAVLKRAEDGEAPDQDAPVVAQMVCEVTQPVDGAKAAIRPVLSAAQAAAVVPVGKYVIDVRAKVGEAVFYSATALIRVSDAVTPAPGDDA